jgi:hypothetical protein
MRAIPQARDREAEWSFWEKRHTNVGSSVVAWLLARVDDVATDLFVALQL